METPRRKRFIDILKEIPQSSLFLGEPATELFSPASGDQSITRELRTLITLSHSSLIELKMKGSVVDKTRT